MKIYVPDLENYKCYIVRDTNTLRAYKEIPQRNTEIEYRDYYINSHYLYQDGTQLFGNYTSTYLPVCLNSENLTDSVYYRNDISDILIVFIIMCIFCFYIPLKVFMRLFRRFN